MIPVQISGYLLRIPSTHSSIHLPTHTSIYQNLGYFSEVNDYLILIAYGGHSTQNLLRAKCKPCFEIRIAKKRQGFAETQIVTEPSLRDSRAQSLW